MTLDIAMGGSTNTVLHLLAAAHEGEVPFTMPDIDRLSRRVPVPVQGRAVGRRRAYGGRAPRRRRHRASWANSIAPACSIADVPTVHAATLGDALNRWDIDARPSESRARPSIRAAPGGVPTQVAFSQERRFEDARYRSRHGLYPRHASTPSRKDGGLAVLYGNLAEDGCIVKTAGVDEEHPDVLRPGAGLRKPGRRGRRHPRRQGQAGRRRGDPLRRPERRARHAGDAVPDQLPQIEGPRQRPAR